MRSPIWGGPSERSATRHDAGEIAAAIVEAVREGTRDRAHAAVTVSVGAAAISPDPVTDVAMVMAEVDRAMYQAKLAGRDRHAVAPSAVSPAPRAPVASTA